MEVITCKDAKAVGLKKYFTGKPCKHGHISERLVCNRKCCTCNYLQKTKWREDNYSKYMDQHRDYVSRNKKRIQEYTSQWTKCNADRKNLSTANRRAAKLNATPNWLTDNMISDIEGLYKESSEKSTPHHVDHIVPLQGKGVCGLHVPWNLQVIPAEDNLKKSNNFD